VRWLRAPSSKEYLRRGKVTLIIIYKSPKHPAFQFQKATEDSNKRAERQGKDERDKSHKP
jgi:hypothetical protein